MLWKYWIVAGLGIVAIDWGLTLSFGSSKLILLLRDSVGILLIAGGYYYGVHQAKATRANQLRPSLGADWVRQALQATEERVVRILENQSIYISSAYLYPDCTWEYDYVPASEAIFGYSVDEFMATPDLWLSRWLPEDLERLKPAFKGLFNQQTLTIEYRFHRRDGQIRWISHTLMSSRDDVGDRWHITGIATDITDRKRSEEALQQQETRFQNLAANVPGVIYQYVRSADGSNGRLTYISPNCRELLEVEAEVLIQHPEMLAKLVHPEDLPKMLATAAAAGKSGQPWRHEYRIVTPSGKVKWVQGYSRSEPSEHGEQIRDGLTIDISDRKRSELDRLAMEAALRDSEEQYRLLFNSTVDMVFVHGVDLTTRMSQPFTAVNKAACQRLGYTEAELLQQRPTDIVSRKTIAEGKAVMVEILTQRQTLFEAEVCTKNGNLIPVEVNAQLFDLHGQPTVLAIAREITERKQAEDAVRRSEAFFRQIFADAPISMALVALDGAFLKVNQEFCQMLGYSEVDLRSRNILDLTDASDLNQERPLMEQLLAGEIPTYQIEKRLRHSSRDVLWVRLTAGLLHNTDGKAVCELVMAEDITDRKVVQQMKDNFVSMVSHELRTPLTSLRGALGLLATGQLGSLSTEGQELLGIASLESQRLVRLVHDILDLERLKSGRISLVKEHCSIDELVHQAIERMATDALAAGVKIQSTVLPIKVWADPDRILQTLANLLSNAIKFSPPGETISVKAIATTHVAHAKPSSDNNEAAFLLVSIQDRGRGIPPNKLQIIFKPFEQVDASDARQKGGTGLGLAICQNIISQHGGVIWAESSIGQGSTFHFTLPLAAH